MSIARMPAVFVGHGSPMVAIQDDDYNRTLARFAASLPRPRAIIVVSAHWEAGAPIRITGAAHLPTIHDFGGFPDELHALQYPAVGEPALAAELVATLAAAGHPAVLDPTRGLDHGAWVPLRFMYPAADVPVVGVSLPVPRSPEELLALGALLAPFRERGILVLGSGGLVHNLRRVDFRHKYAPVDSWAAEFDAWVATTLASPDPRRLAHYASAAPHARLAVPTSEHFDPALVIVGAAAGPLTPIFTGFHHATLSMRCFATT